MVGPTASAGGAVHVLGSAYKASPASDVRRFKALTNIPCSAKSGETNEKSKYIDMYLPLFTMNHICPVS